MKTITVIIISLLTKFIIAQDLNVKPAERLVYHINPLDTSQKRLAVISQYDICGNLIEEVYFKYRSFSEKSDIEEDWRITYNIQYAESCLLEQVEKFNESDSTSEKTIYEYDDRKNTLSEKVSNTEGKIVEHVTFEYDNFEQLKTETRFEANDKIVGLINYAYKDSLLSSKEMVNFKTQDTILFSYKYSSTNELERTDWYVKNDDERGFDLISHSDGIKYVTHKTENRSQYFVNSFYANGLERGWETIWSDSDKTESIVIYKYILQE